MATLTPIRAEMTDGRTLRTQADQRAFAATEVAGIDRAHIHTWVRHLGWAALRAAGMYEGSWEKFNADCIEVSDVPEREGPAGAEDGLDPGRKAPPAGKP